MMGCSSGEVEAALAVAISKGSGHDDRSLCMMADGASWIRCMAVVEIAVEY